MSEGGRRGAAIADSCMCSSVTTLPLLHTPQPCSQPHPVQDFQPSRHSYCRSRCAAAADGLASSPAPAQPGIPPASERQPATVTKPAPRTRCKRQAFVYTPSSVASSACTDATTSASGLTCRQQSLCCIGMLPHFQLRPPCPGIKLGGFANGYCARHTSHPGNKMFRHRYGLHAAAGNTCADVLPCHRNGVTEPDSVS